LAVGKLIRVEGLKQLRGVAGIETIGLDLGDRFSQFCAVGGKGEVLQEGRVPTTVVGMRRFFGGMEPVTVAVETGTHSPWVSRLLFSFGHRVLVAHARKLRLIYENRNKRDEVDARYLARIARLDPELLYPVRHRGESAQKDLAVLRSREALVAARTQMVNHVRGSVKSFGARLPSCSTPAFPKRVGEHVPESLKAALLPVLDCVSQLTEQIKEFDRRIHALIEESYPEAKRLMQVHGVGEITSLAYVLRLEDAGRFERSRTVGAYLGLVPAKDRSGESDPQLRITKEGNALLRRLLVQCAHYILGAFGSDSDLRGHGLRIAERGGKNAKKRAVVAVARKLAVVLHRLWRTGEIYQPLYNTERKSKRVGSGEKAMAG
jgi:transposase